MAEIQLAEVIVPSFFLATAADPHYDHNHHSGL